MTRHFRNRHDVGDVPVPLTMMDLAWIVTIMTLCAAQFGVGNVRLPQLPAHAQVAASTAGRKGIELAIGTDGKLLLQGRPVTLEEVGDRVKAIHGADQTLMLSLETQADGTGHTERLVQLVDRLQRDRVENPLEVRTRRQPAGNVPRS